MAPQPPPPLSPPLHQIAALYNSYVLPVLPEPLQSLSHNISPFLASISSTAMNGDIVSFAALLLTIYLFVKIADYVRRSVFGWVIFFIKIALGLVALQAVFYINRNGMQKALSDAEWVLGLLWGLLEQKVARLGNARDNQTGGFGGTGGYAYGGGKQQDPIGKGRAQGRSGSRWR